MINENEYYFMSDLSFYSMEFGGTFHFMQFSMLNKEEFFASKEFKHFMQFIMKTYPELRLMQTNESTADAELESKNEKWVIERFRDFVDKIQFKKTTIELKKCFEFNEKFYRQNMFQMPILSTGGYNDQCLMFIANCFNTKIVKCREFLIFLTTAIDYLNKWTNDCFFSIMHKP